MEKGYKVTCFLITVMHGKRKNVYTALCGFIPFLYAGALCGCFMPWLIQLYAIWFFFRKCFMPGSVRDGLTRKRKRK